MRFNSEPRFYPPPLHPVFSYFGSKWRLARDGKYPEPLHGVIIEPFAGSAGYSLHYHQSEVVLVDQNETITDIWNLLQSCDLRETLEGLPDEIDYVPEHLSPSVRALIGLWVAHGVSAPRTKATSWAKRHPGDLWWGPRVKQRLIEQAPYLRHWHVRLGSYRSLPDVVATWFIDAPYQHQSKRYPYSDIDYADLADFCRTRRGQVIVCEGGPARWLPFEPLAPGRKKTSRASGEIGLEEVCWYREN